MKNARKQFVAALGLAALATAAIAAGNPMVGGKEMLPNKDIISW